MFTVNTAVDTQLGNAALWHTGYPPADPQADCGLTADSAIRATSHGNSVCPEMKRLHAKVSVHNEFERGSLLSYAHEVSTS